MVQCGVSPSGRGNVAAQDGTVSLSAVEMSSAETAGELDSPFANTAAIMCDHSCLPTRFGGLGQCSGVHCRICCSAGSEKALL